MTSDTVSANPFVGPSTFSEAQRHLFFGREREARDLLARVLSERLVLFYAQSGAGKSSLLHARLIPQLRDERGFGVLPVGRISGELPPDVSQVQNIFVFNLLLSIDQGSDSARLANVTLPDFLARLVYHSGRWAYDATARPTSLLAPGQVGRRYALIVDQFEEIFTSHPARWAEREAFFRQLDQAMEDDPNLWVVLALREDYVAALDPYASLLTDRLRGRFYMERMSVDAALEAVREPAKAYGRPFAPDAAETLVQDLSRVKVLGQATAQPGQYVEPVQLQVVCYQLWENLAATGPLVPGGGVADIITAADVQAAGDVDTALARFYEETLAVALDDPATAGVSERQLRAWFDTELITPTGTRGLVLQGAEVTGGLPNSVVSQLQARFLVRSESRAGSVWVELVHDRLVEPIRANNAAWFPAHLSALQRQAALWNEQQRPSGLLLRDAALVEAEAWAAAHADELEPYEQDFLAACREARAATEREQRQTRRIRMLAVAAMIVSVLALVAALIARHQMQQTEAARQKAVNAMIIAEANEREAGRQTAIARSSQSSIELGNAHFEPALLLAIEAAHLTEKFDVSVQEVFDAIGDAINSHVRGRVIYGHTGRVVQAVWSHDESKIITASADHTARIWDAATGAELVKLVGHTELVWQATESRDGSKILTASDDHTARIWDAATGAQLVTMQGHTGPVLWAAWNRDEAKILTASEDHSARIWDAATGVELSKLVGHTAPVLQATWSHDGSKILTASKDGTARIWGANDSAELFQLTGHMADVVQATWSSDDSQILTASQDGTVRIWDAATGAELVALTGHAGPVLQATWNQDESRIITAGADKTARIWDAATGVELVALTGHTGSVIRATWSHDASKVLTASQDGTVRIWDAITGAGLGSLVGHMGAILQVTWSQDESEILTASVDNTARIWDVAVGAKQIKLVGHTSDVYWAAWSHDDSKILTASADKTARVWSAASGAELVKLVGHTAPVAQALWNHDDSKTLTTSVDKTVRIWDAVTGAELVKLAGHTATVYWAQWNQDESKILTASEDKTVRIWDAATGAELNKLEGHTGPVLQATWNQDESKILTASRDGTARIWDATNGAELVKLQGHTADVYWAAWSHDNTKIATASADHTGRIWDATSGAELVKLQGHTADVVHAIWSLDDSRILSASWDNTARIWDAATGSELANLQGHTGPILWVTWSPDNSKVLTASWDGAARIWGAETGVGLIKLEGHTAGLEQAVWSQDGSKVVTASDDATARIWDATSGAEFVAAICRRTPRNFTWDEWNRFIKGSYRPTCAEAPIPPDVIQAIQAQAATQVQAGNITRATETLDQLNGWLRKNGQYPSFHVDIQNFIRQAFESGLREKPNPKVAIASGLGLTAALSMTKNLVGLTQA